MKRALSKSFLVWACIPAVLCIAALWYQFGFTLGGMIEEWDFLWVMNRVPNFWNSFPGSQMSEQFAARPFQITPYAIARALDHRSFIGFHLMLMGACFLRIIAGASIGYFLFRNRTYALALGLLFLVFPADTQQMTFRTLSISVAVALMSIGAALALRALLAPTRIRRISALVIGALCTVSASFIYEGVLPLYALPVLLLSGRYAWFQSLRVLRRRRAISIFWCVAPLVNAAYLAYAIVIAKSSYQVKVAQNGMLRSIIENRSYLARSLGYRVFYDSWIDAWDVLMHQTMRYGFLIIVGIGILGTLLSVANGRSDAGVVRLVRYVLVGLLAMVAAYMPFMVSASYMEVTQRTFIGVAPGASIVFVSLFALICTRRAIPGAIVASFIIFLSMVAQLYQFDLYNRLYSSITLPYLSLMADRTDLTKNVHLVLDTTGYGGYFNGMYISKVRNGASDRLWPEKTDNYELCMNTVSQMILSAKCALDKKTWNIHSADRSTTFQAGDVQVLKIGPDLDPSYRSKRGVWNDRGSFAATKSIFKPDVTDLSNYKCEADSDWGYTRFCRGEGWSNGLYRMQDHTSYFVATDSDPTLLFDLEPAEKPYRLSVRTLGINAFVDKNMTISINGSLLKWSTADQMVINANAPARTLKNGLNEIEFRQTIQPGTTTGLPITDVTLTKLTGSD